MSTPEIIVIVLALVFVIVAICLWLWRDGYIHGWKEAAKMWKASHDTKIKEIHKNADAYHQAQTDYYMGEIHGIRDKILEAFAARFVMDGKKKEKE